MNHVALFIGEPPREGTPVEIATGALRFFENRMQVVRVAATHDHQGRAYPIVLEEDPSEDLHVVKAASDHDHRNAALALVRAYHPDTDRIWIVDFDEFYFDAEFDALLEESMTCDILYTRRIAYWKGLNWRIDPPEPAATTVCINPKSVPAFLWSRNPAILSGHVQRLSESAVQHHLTAVKTDEEMERKIRSFIHGPEIAPDWFGRVWKGWTPDMEDLHPTHPGCWKRAIAVDSPVDLPEILRPLWESYRA